MVINHVPDLVAKKFEGKVNVSQVQRDTGLTYTTVTRWLKKTVDRIDTPILETWCRYLGANVGELLEHRPDDQAQA